MASKSNIKSDEINERSNEMRSVDLPQEIIEDILIKLPVKSIIRFKIVSKSWLYLIKSNPFIQKHLLKNESFLAICFDVPDKSSQLRFLDVCRYDDRKETSVSRVLEGIDVADSGLLAGDYKWLTVQLPPRNKKISSGLSYYLEDLELVGNCNGILCFSDFSTVLLVNPSLSELRPVPVPLVSEEYFKLVGFGFDDINVDYKIVGLMSFGSGGVIGPAKRAEVYSLRSNAWRKLDENRNQIPIVVNYSTVNYSTSCSTFFNGNVHWCVATEPYCWRILTFNLATELFHLMEIPQGWCDIPSDSSPDLFVLNQESFAFVSYRYPYFENQFFNVWRMNKYGIEETWTKLYSIQPPLYFLKPISLLKNHKFLYESMTGELILYDLNDHHSSVIFGCSQIYGYRKNVCSEHSSVQVGICRSSLVSINM